MIAHLLGVKSFTAGLSLPLAIHFISLCLRPALCGKELYMLFPASRGLGDNDLVAFRFLEEVLKHSTSTPIIYWSVHWQAPQILPKF